MYPFPHTVLLRRLSGCFTGAEDIKCILRVTQFSSQFLPMSRTSSYRSNFDNCVLFLNLIWFLLGFARNSLQIEQSVTFFKSPGLQPLLIHQQHQMQYAHSHGQSHKVGLLISKPHSKRQKIIIISYTRAGGGFKTPYGCYT